MSNRKYYIGDVLINDLPKISLHDHLDGSLKPETIIDLAKIKNYSLPTYNAEELAEHILEQSKTGSLEKYLQSFQITCYLMQDAHSLKLVAKDYVEQLSQDGVIYAEVRWAPELHTSESLTMIEAISAVSEGLAEGMAEYKAYGKNIVVKQIISAMRQNSNSLEVSKAAVASKNIGVVAFDLAGPEKNYPVSLHKEAFDYAFDNFLPTTIHAGEADGVFSIISALKYGRALRLGHGVRIIDDIELVYTDESETKVSLGDLAQWVRDHEIALEIAPSSNLHTGAANAKLENLQSHCFDMLYQLGFTVTVNPDNRLMSSTSVSKEIHDLYCAFSYSLDDIMNFQLNAVAASFLSLEDKAKLAQTIHESFDI